MPQASESEPEAEKPPPLHPRRRAKPKAKRPKHRYPEWDALIKACWEQGAWIELTPKGYLRILPPPEIIPQGAGASQSYIHGSPNRNGTAVRNQRGDLKRLGFKL